MLKHSALLLADIAQSVFGGRTTARLSVYVLAAIAGKRLNISASLYEMLQILCLTMFAKTSLR